MLEINIPGFENLQISHLILDYNGTLALDGSLITGVMPLLNELAKKVQIHILTGDTFGTVKHELAGINGKLTILPPQDQAVGKQNYLRGLHSKETVAIGNGQNDEYMLKEASLGIAILGKEGTAIATILAADIVVSDIFTALHLLQYPKRLLATLRS